MNSIVHVKKASNVKVRQNQEKRKRFVKTSSGVVVITVWLVVEALAGPCRSDVGGMCGADLDNYRVMMDRIYHLRHETPPPQYSDSDRIPQRGQYMIPSQVGRPVPINAGGYRGNGLPQMGGRIQVAHPWTGHRDGNGIFHCESGPCPANGKFGN